MSLSNQGGSKCTLILFIYWVSNIYFIYFCFFCGIIYIKGDFHICSEPINPKLTHLGWETTCNVQENIYKQGMHFFINKNDLEKLHYQQKEESFDSL